MRPYAGLLVLTLGAALAAPSLAAGRDEVAFARATALARAGRCAEALPILAGLSVQDARSVHLRAQCQLEAKDWPAALASLEETKRLDPAAPGLSLQLAVARFHMGDFAGSREALDAAGPTAQEDPQYHLYRGLVLLQETRSAEAARELSRARQMGAQRVEPGASYYEGLAWAGAEDEARAREALDRVIETAPGTPWALEAERAKAQLDRLADGRSDVWAFAKAGLEYDDNVRLLANDVFPTADPTDDARPETHDVRAVWLLHGGVQLVEGPGWAAGVQATYYGSSHFDLTAFNQHYPLVGAWYDQRLAAATSLRLSYDVGYAWYQYDPFLFSQQARASLFHDFGEAGRTELFASPYKYNFLYGIDDVPDQDSPATPPAFPGACVRGVQFCSPAGVDESDRRNRDGWGANLGVEHRIPLGVLETELHGGVAYLHYSARGRDYSYDGVGTWIGSETELPFEAALRFWVGYSHLGYRHASSYPDPGRVPAPIPTPPPPAPPPGQTTGSAYPLDQSDRHDDRWFYAVELEKYITETWSASLRYSYGNNNSNAPVFAYDREILGAYVTYRWNR